MLAQHPDDPLFTREAEEHLDDAYEYADALLDNDGLSLEEWGVLTGYGQA